MGLRNRMKATALASQLKRLHALDLFTAVVDPITYPELLAQQAARERQAALRAEAREAKRMQWELQHSRQEWE